MKVKDAVIETLEHLPVSRQKELLHFAQLLQSKMKLNARPAVKAKQPKPRKSRIVMDNELGLPVLTAGEDAPMVTHERIRELLADFP